MHSDVDDLEDISKLDEYIAASADVLIFLSAGYWSSSNCLIEARATVAQGKPIVLRASPACSNGICARGHVHRVLAPRTYLVSMPRGRPPICLANQLSSLTLPPFPPLV